MAKTLVFRGDGRRIRRELFIQPARLMRHIRYKDRDGVRSDRMIMPLALMYTDQTLTVLSWCCLREAFRMFRADRIAGIEPAGRSSRPKRVSLLGNYMAQLESESHAKVEDGVVDGG